MQEGLRAEIRRIIALALFLVVFGLFNGFPLVTLLLGGGLYMVFTLDRINRLYAWLAADTDTMPPEASGVWGDISDYLYRLKRRIDQSQKNYTSLALRIRQITSALDDGMLLLNADHTLDWWNPAATGLLHLRESDKGENIVNLIRNPQFVDFINGRDFSQPLELRTPYEPQRTLLFTAGSFGRGEIVVVAQDITRLRHLEEIRKEFVANVSHELRTPLTVLSGYIETLQSSADDLAPHWQRALVQMDQQTRRLGALAEDLVVLARLESSVTPDRLPVALCPLLRSIVEDQRLLYTDSHRLTLRCRPGLIVIGDSRELHSVFANLVVNAIRHNPRGCDVLIHARACGGNVVVRVMDNGIGVDPRHISRLTERFYRADDSRATSSGGTGLGLAIVKHALGRHNATLRIRGAPGKGAVFSCRFSAPTAAAVATGE